MRRLDALSRKDAERVLERAIRIHDARAGGFDSIDRDRLYQVADELGIDAEAVDRALREVVTDPVRRPSSRFFAPTVVSSSVNVRGEAAEVADRIQTWMTQDEGLRPAAKTGDGIRWAPETHWKTTARVAISGRGTKALKGLRQVHHRQIEVAPSQQVVEIEADTRRVGTVAGSVGGGLLGGALVGGVATAIGMAGGNDVVQFLMVAAPGGAVAVSTAVGIAKIWTHTIRGGVQRALEGIGEPSLGATKAGRRPGVRKLVDDVAGMLDDLLR